MSGFELHIDVALSSLRRLLGDSSAQGDSHRAHSPEFPPSAAGQGFAAKGAAVAQMLKEVHGGVGQRIEAFNATTNAAVEQVGIFAETEDGFAQGISNVEKYFDNEAK